MRIREAAYPILVRFPGYLAGGTGGGYSRPSRFEFNRADYFRTGVWDDAVIFDSQGRVFTVDAIEFTRPGWWRYLLHYAGDFFIPNKRWWDEMVSVDMRLTQTRALDLPTLARELSDVALARSDWWLDRTSAEIEELFTGSSTIADLIDKVGFLGPEHEEKPTGCSKKIVDLRELKAPAAPPPG